MPDIQCLPSHVADLIAAGEVVERPASVAKELLENAIDAGSSAIVVEIQHGGLTYLRIADNGCGIDAEQLPTAFLRHATSKLRTAADLAAIGTLGFRGEALAAISAVSRVDIFSRRTGVETGASLHLEGGVPGQVEEVGCPEGTTICVRDLFYNTPARMKFMKKDSAEGAAVSGIVQHLALSHPEISFKLIRDGVELLHTPGDGDLQSAVYAAMGRDFAMGLLPISGCSGDISVEGFVTKPLNGHGTRGRQLFFVNGRFIKSQLLTAALEEAYRNQLLKGKFPGCVLRLTMPADRLDVNVHPAKTVVKFVNDKEAFNAVYYTVLDALNTPIPQPKKPRQESFYQTMTVQQYRERAPQPEEKKPLGSYTVRPAAPASQPLEVHDVAPRRGESFTVTSSGVSYRITPPAVQKEPSAPAASVPEETVPVPAEPVQETSVPSPAEEKAVPQSAAQQTVEPVCQTPWRVVGEVLRTYIICEDDQENVWLIDKHAAHERVRFDALKNHTQPVMSQQLLSPLAVELSAEDAASLLEQLPLLEEFGFVCEDFGDGTVLVRQVPSDLEVGDVPAALEELAEDLRLNRADPTAARDSLLQTMACKSAIKAGMWSDPSELQALADKVQSGEIRYCPHGRPVAVKLSKYEMEKMFKRA
ncbi:MAG: DNA mismatch repair endonuclease MutL [Firmicutes bacterium]|nr:DNA mismatch repair endonuclease MutL [Bacillota bacterium]